MAWDLTADDVERIAIGAGILGTGGGGNPFRGMMRALMELEQGRGLQVIRLEELADDDLIVPMGGIGAPTIGLEKLGRGDEGRVAVEALQQYLDVEIVGTVPIEIGGGSSFSPMIAAAQLGIPTVDADGMGRAFPKGSMISFYFDGVAPSPIAMVDAHHKKLIFENLPDTIAMEDILRPICVLLGGTAMVAFAPMTVRRLRETAIPETLTLAHQLGDAILAAQAAGEDPIAALCQVTNGRELFVGKIVDVDRRVERGYNFGRLEIEGLAAYRNSLATIDLQNEFLICRVDEELKAIVPDLITLVDSDRGTPVTTEVVRYGLRVTAIGIAAPPQLTTDQAMRYVGPAAFGYSEPYLPLLDRLTPA